MTSKKITNGRHAFQPPNRAPRGGEVSPSISSPPAPLRPPFCFHLKKNAHVCWRQIWNHEAIAMDTTCGLGRQWQHLGNEKCMKMEDGKIRKKNPANLPIRKIGSFFGRTFGCAKKIGGLLKNVICAYSGLERAHVVAELLSHEPKPQSPQW